MLVRLFVLSLTVLISTSLQAVGGAWPREKGQVFLSLAATQETDRLDENPTLSVYGEYGLRHNITVAGKITYDFALEEVTDYEISGRWHFPDNGNPLRTALSLTLVGPTDDVRVEPGVHLGRGFETPIGPGWLDVELFASFSTEGDATEYGGFGVLGVKPHDRLMTMFGVDVLVTPDDTFVKAVPQLAWELKPGRHLNMQYSKGLSGTDESELGLGLWLEF